MCGSVEDVLGALVGLVHCPVQLGLLGAFVVCKLAYNTQHATLQDATLQHTHRVCAVRLHGSTSGMHDATYIAPLQRAACNYATLA
jgi:hypothetical protein